MNPETVERLVLSSLEHMAEVAEGLDASGNEVISAWFTLTRRAIRYIMAMDNPEAHRVVRDVMEMMLMETMDPKKLAN